MTDQLELDRVKAPAKEPAKRWTVCVRLKPVPGGFFVPGDGVVNGPLWIWPNVYPNREIAETVGREWFARAKGWGGYPYIRSVRPVEAP